jgi:ABC-type phosphate transport system permease subunit
MRIVQDRDLLSGKWNLDLMVEIVIPALIAVPLALLGAAWIYRDATERRMDTADMWAVGFFVAFFIPPIIGGVLVYAFYLRKRKGRGGASYTVPTQ